jgi:hypothetical protein
MVTAILLNWKRTDNLKKVIQSIRSQSIPIDIWLWDNAKVKSEYDVDKHFISPINLKCFPRWCLASMIQTKYFFVIDDDIILNDKNVIKDCLKYHESQNISDLILGFTGVTLNDSKEYWASEHLNNCDFDASVDIVKGRFMFMKRILMNKVNLGRSFTCEDIKVSAASNNKLLPSFLYNRLSNLKEGDEALHKTKGQKQKRQDAVIKFFCN